MPRFICNHPTTLLVKHITPSGKVLAFDYRGVLDTDAEGAAVIRADPHGTMVECLACGRRFIQDSWTPRLYCDAKCRGRGIPSAEKGETAGREAQNRPGQDGAGLRP
jgi:hypothetical protein